jgi:hypothetical protein
MTTWKKNPVTNRENPGKRAQAQEKQKEHEPERPKKKLSWVRKGAGPCLALRQKPPTKTLTETSRRNVSTLLSDRRVDLLLDIYPLYHHSAIYICSASDGKHREAIYIIYIYIYIVLHRQERQS